MPNPKHLVVEAQDDQGAVIGLMRHHVKWGDGPDNWTVEIDWVGSADEALDPLFLGPKIKTAGLKTLGLMLDADDKFAARWRSIKAFCDAHVAPAPKAMPAEGLIVEGANGKRFGAWIMPNNKSDGMLETFCKALVPNAAAPLWKFAEASFSEAQKRGAPCHAVHTEKAHIHTWLAWQAPPGERIGVAITKKMLDPNAASAQAFVKWFKSLYRL